MKINFYGVMSKFKTDALVRAMGVEVKTEPKNRVDDYFIVNGVILDSYPEVGHRMLFDFNFMVDAGLKGEDDVERLLDSRDSRGYPMFFIEE